MRNRTEAQRGDDRVERVVRKGKIFSAHWKQARVHAQLLGSLACKLQHRRARVDARDCATCGVVRKVPPCPDCDLQYVSCCLLQEISTKLGEPVTHSTMETRESYRDASPSYFCRISSCVNSMSGVLGTNFGKENKERRKTHCHEDRRKIREPVLFGRMEAFEKQ